MSYKKAVEVLPQSILEMIQEYVDGEYLYIPRRESNKKCWGEQSNTKKENYERNIAIYEAYKQGYSNRELSEYFFLSEKSIQRILLKMKREYKPESSTA